MKKSVKIIFSTLLAGIVSFTAGCSSSANVSNGDASSTEKEKITQTVASVETTENNATNVALATEEESGSTTDAGSASTQTVTAEVTPAPTQINLSGGSLAAKEVLTTKGFGISERAFSSIRFGTTVSHGSDAMNDATLKVSYGWPTVYLGVKETEQDYYDISQATDFYIFLKNVEGTTPKIKWRAVDADGTVQKLVDYTTKKGSLRKLDGTTATISSSDGNGSLVSTTDTGIFLHSSYSSDSVLDGNTQFATGNDGAFDATKVVAFMLSITSNGTKTFDIGSMSAVIDGEEVVIWDADEATEKKYTDIFKNDTKAFSDFSLNKNEWYMGAIPAGITTDPTDWTSETIGVVADYQNAEGLEYTYQSGASLAVVPLYEDDGLNYIENSTTFDLSACNALTFHADFTKVTDTNALDFTIRPTQDGSKEIIYSSAAERAILLSNDGEYSTCYANALPAGFKGQVIIPFTSFKTAAGSVLSESPYLNNVLRIDARLLVNGTYEEGDYVNLTDIQVLKKSEEEFILYDKLKQYTQRFEMQSTATLSEDPFGIYFGVTASNKYHTELISAFEGVEGLTYEFGMIIIPADDTSYASAMPHDDGILTISKENSGALEDSYFYRWYAGIKNISEDCYDMAFKARAYVQYTLNGESYMIWATEMDAGVSLYDLCSAVSAETRTAAMQAVVDLIDGANE